VRRSKTSLWPRVLALTLVWLLATATFTMAAGEGSAPVASAPAAPTEVAQQAPAELIVPDVRRQAYVFAKGILQDGGFAWEVSGKVKGFAANIVVGQSPAPGTRVLDTGAPVVSLQLKRNAKYEERGLPENSSPYEGTEIVLLDESLATASPDLAALSALAEALAAAPASPPAASAAEPAAPAEDSASLGESQKPTKATPAASEPKFRKPDFAVPGAKREPANEMPLPDRARMLERRLASAPRPTGELLDFWSYQHAWIVTGARFGWQNGAAALRILIRVDEDLQRRWRVGFDAEGVARDALAFVQANTAR
jgi:hypothetical protein